MAKKANLAKQWQEMLGQAEVTDRQPSTPGAALYMMHSRTASRKISMPKHRLAVVVEDGTDIEKPRPVKINRHHRHDLIKV